MVHGFYYWSDQCIGAVIRISTWYHSKANAGPTFTFSKKIDLVYDELSAAHKLNIK